jgi:hypothetical protein
MSSNYCVQLTSEILVLSITTANPVNFTNLQFSLSVNSLVIFLFSKYPFNFGYAGNFCINQDEFGFAEVGTSFNIDLTNYQGYYMLILIYPEGNNFANVGACQIVPNLTMTFQNTTISPVQNITVNSNFDGQAESGFCVCYQGQSMIPRAYCSNYSIYSTISLNNLNNYLVIITCQGFLIQNNTTVEFITPHTCVSFGAYVSALIEFNANQQVIDFLNNNNISYNILSSTSCQSTSSLFPCNLPCKSFYQITKLLSPPTKYSIISSKLWNEIVQDLYLAYSIFKYINYLSQYTYLEYIPSTILDFYNFYENFQPYPFTPLLYAQKGIPLTVNDFNKLINAIVELANENNIKLQKRLSYVQHDQIVKASQFADIVYNVNQFLTFNHNQYFLLSCTGNEFNNLLNLINTFLTVLINNLTINITIPSNVYIKNLLIYQATNGISAYGSIGNLIINQNNYGISLYDYSFINLININLDEGGVYLNNNSSANSINIVTENTGIYLNDYSTLYTLNIETDNGGVYLSNYASANRIIVQIENAGVYLYNNTYINTLYVGDNIGGIYLYDNAVIENLICKQNSGGVYVSGNAKIINNQCSS